MTRYLILANGWLLFSFLLQAGKVTERSSPTMYSFFGIGGWQTVAEYNFLTFASTLIAAFFFYLTWRTRPLTHSTGKPAAP